MVKREPQTNRQVQVGHKCVSMSVVAKDNLGFVKFVVACKSALVESFSCQAVKILS